MKYFINHFNGFYKHKILRRTLTHKPDNSNKHDKTTFDFGSFLFFFVCLAGLSKNSRNQ